MRSCILRREIRHERYCRREDNEDEQEEGFCYDASWLFLDRGADLQVLRQLTCKNRYDVHSARWDAKRRQRIERYLARNLPELHIRSGAWLFNNMTSTGSLEHLIRLSDHSSRFEQFDNIYWHRYYPCYSEQGACQVSYCRHCRNIKEEEKQNGKNIFELFPRET